MKKVNLELTEAEIEVLITALGVLRKALPAGTIIHANTKRDVDALTKKIRQQASK